MKTGKYKHYKGETYYVERVVPHTETQEKMVLYYSTAYPELFDEYGNPTYFVRPYEMFVSDVEYNGKIMKRFTHIN